MAFKIPPPWNPGYALPGYVTAEGLQSRAFITKWTPRGTYDDPDVCDPSWDHQYAVPQYVKDEGYGQGAYVTEWLPRGFYVGFTKRAHQIKQAQRVHRDPALPGPFGEYGRRSAAVLIESARRLPPSMRKDGLRKLMGAIDPTLYERTARYAKQHANRGVQSDTALELGLSRAMSQGLADEIVQVGKTGRRPSPKGQLGLGCYGCAAVVGAGGLAGLGDTLMTVISPVSALDPSMTVVSPVPALAPSMGQCSADGNYIWKGYWARRAVGEACTGTFSGGPTSSGASSGGISGATAGGAAPVAELQMIDVGPFKVPLNVSQFTIHWSGAMPADWRAFIIPELAREPDVAATAGTIHGRLRDFFPDLPARINSKFVGFETGTAAAGLIGGAAAIGYPEQPIVMVKRPDTGEEWGIYMQIGARDPNKPWDSSSNPWVLNLLWRKPPAGIGIWSWIKRMAGKLVDVAKDALDAVGGLACSLLSSQGAGVAAGAAAAASGAPPATGAQGVAIAAAACGQPPPPPGTGAAADWFLPVAIAGGALLAVAYFLPKKKKASP